VRIPLENNIVHRDIRWDNIIRLMDSSWTLIDCFNWRYKARLMFRNPGEKPTAANAIKDDWFNDV
jgi:hypothetical protein